MTRWALVIWGAAGWLLLVWLLVHLALQVRRGRVLSRQREDELARAALVRARWGRTFEAAEARELSEREGAQP